MYSSCHPPEVLFCQNVERPKKPKTLYLAGVDEMQMLQLSSLFDRDFGGLSY
ncbi:hypothetical protein NDI43_09850 [Microcoleus vaginatus GB2-A3]|uniref:hypothetical protein n=1 Tax=Microcoleus vaginatus TaxID=119532 RepID=UPI0032A36940